MTNAVLTIVYSDVPGFPAGSVVDHVTASITNTTDVPPVTMSQKAAPGTASVTFAGVDPGNYTVTVSGRDANDGVLGTAATGTFTITAPATVTLSLPASVSVVQS